MSKGRVDRACGCTEIVTDANGKPVRDAGGRIKRRQLGESCPLLRKDRRHGTWYFAVDVPTVDGRRKTVRKRGFKTKRAAEQALADLQARYSAQAKVCDREKFAEWSMVWLDGKKHTLKAKTWHRYREIVVKYLIPALGALPIEYLRHDHVAAMFADMQAAGRGVATIHAVHAVLSSALADAVRQRRLSHNAARHVALPPLVRTERTPWTAAEAVAFLDYCHRAGERHAELFELLIGTGLRRGEALALQWRDVDLAARVLTIDPRRGQLSSVAGELVFTAPKTRGSAAGVGLSPRVVAALERQATRQAADRAAWAEAYQDHGLVFAREDGRPPRPNGVLERFQHLSKAAGLPQVRLHDLRHLAATLMLTSGVPLPLVSKTLRHSQTGITADLYGHLTREAALSAADTLGSVLDAASAELANERAARAATTPRPHRHDRSTEVGAAASETAGPEPGDRRVPVLAGPHRVSDRSRRRV